MKRFVALLAAAPLTVLVLLAAGRQQPLTYGTLDNFDVINDTGQETHGFEIELEGIATTDVVYTFAAPYIRYDTPSIVPNQAGTGVIVRYAATYGAAGWSAGTPIAVAPYLPTQGHSCWTGGVADPATYYAAGCDHFGVSLTATPTNTIYRWLVENPSAPGTLVPFNTNVKMPAPTWNVTPPAQQGGQPIVALAIKPPAPDQFEFGDALWAKIYVTELPNGLQPDDLEHMVIDDPVVDIMPEPAEVEIEWVLLQDSTGGGGEQEFGGLNPIGPGAEAVSRRIEFYAYTGYYDPETNEARCDDPTDPAQQVTDRCGDPNQDGLAGVGDLIGTQNVAINVAGDFAPNTAPVALCAPITVAADSLTCNATASIDDVSYDPDGDPITLSQSPAGPYALGVTPVTLTVSDDHQLSSTCQANVTIEDISAPGVSSIAAAPNTLRPVNGKMVPVTVAVSAFDGCDPAPVCRITNVESSEDDTGIKGDKSPDIQVTGNLTVNLRAQRDKKGPGRVYTIYVLCTDVAGNGSVNTTTVSVIK